MLFFALLSALLFGCLAFSVMHNATQIAQLQQQLQEISDMETSQQDILAKLIGEVSEKVSKTDQGAKSYAPNYRVRRQDTTNIELNGTTTTTAAKDPNSVLVTLLANALLGIVDSQLNAKLDCDKVDDATQCTILPGPKGEKGDRGRRGRIGDRGFIGEKGEKGFWGSPGRPGLNGDKGDQGDIGEPGSQGEIGPRGPVGEKGDQGDVGERGEKGSEGYPGPRGLIGDRGEKGQSGYPGYKGEKGQVGDRGLQGPVGPQGSVGPRGPTTSLTQNSCVTRSIPSRPNCDRGGCNGYIPAAMCSVGQYVAGHGIGNFVCCPVS